MLHRKAHTGTDAYTPTPGLVARLEAILTARVKPYAVRAEHHNRSTHAV